MKKLPLLLFLFLWLPLSRLSAQFEGTFGIGVHTAYGAAVNSVGAGAHLHYYPTNNWRLAPSFTRYLEHKGEGMWMVETDLHYLLPLNYSASLYPIAGIHYSNWSHDAGGEGELPAGVRKRDRLGASLGIGLQHDISYRVRMNYELKHQFINDYDQLSLMVGFGFWF